MARSCSRITTKRRGRSQPNCRGNSPRSYLHTTHTRPFSCALILRSYIWGGLGKAAAMFCSMITTGGGAKCSSRPLHNNCMRAPETYFRFPRDPGTNTFFASWPHFYCCSTYSLSLHCLTFPGSSHPTGRLTLSDYRPRNVPRKNHGVGRPDVILHVVARDKMKFGEAVVPSLCLSLIPEQFCPRRYFYSSSQSDVLLHVMWNGWALGPPVPRYH